MHLVTGINSKSKALHVASAGNTLLGRGVWDWLIGWLVQQFGGFRTGGSSVGGPQMQVLETLSVGPKKQLILLRCASETYLIGTGPESVQSILRIESRASDRSVVVPELGERS